MNSNGMGRGPVAIRRGRTATTVPVALLLLLATAAATTRAAGAAPPPARPSSDDVAGAIDAGVRYLLARQDPDTGAWTTVRRGGGLLQEQDAGRTALVGLALINSGVPHHAPEMRKAIDYLKSQKVDSTYGVSLRAAFFSQLPEQARRVDKGADRLIEDRRWLSAAAIDRGDSAGLYTYRPGWNQRMPADLSNSQYAVLGLWYAASAGIETSDALWKQVERGWVQQQNLDGGWGYRPDMRADSYSSMTAAGVATLFVTYDFLHARSELRLTRQPRRLSTAGNETDDREAPAPGAAPQQPSQRKNRDPRVAVQRGLDWIAVNWAADENAGLGRTSSFLYYMLYAYERVAEATGRTRFGDQVWFDQAADFICRTQNADGSWSGEDFIDNVSNTAYALIVLSRGRAPVVLQKVEYDGRWNNRSRDAAQVARWIGRQTERHLNWQIVNTDASLDELRESPILYIAGDDPVELPDPFVGRLREYLLQGGLLLCVAEGEEPPAARSPAATTAATTTTTTTTTAPAAATGFAASIEALGKRLFPRYDFRDLPPDHLLFTANFPAAGGAPAVRGLSNGARELILLLPSGDMSWQWQRGAGTPVVAQAPHFGLAGNLHLYMTDRGNPRFKGERFWPALDVGVIPSARVRVARLRHNGNYDPEPAGWQRLATLLHNRDGIQLDTPIVDPRDLAAGRFAMAHLTSTDAFAFADADLAEVRRYVESGGLLLFDATGGSRAAALAFEDVLGGLYPDGKLASLPIDHPVYTGAPPARPNVQQVAYRKFAFDRLPRTQLPRLKAFTTGGRLVAVVSEEDLSSGLVGHAVDGIVGYAPQSATDLLRNLLLWRADVR